MQISLPKACQDSQWNHDTSTTHRSERNGVAERIVRRVKEGTAISQVQSGLLEEWWDCNWPMARQLSTNDMARSLTGHELFFETMVEYIPITEKVKSRVHQFGKENDDRNILWLCAAGGRRLVRKLVADHEELQEPEAAEVYVQRFKNQEEFSKNITNFPLQTEL